MNHKKVATSNLLALIMALSFLIVPQCSAQIDNLPQDLQNANTAVEQAFMGILSAEKAGANVSDLLEQLNIATGLLAQANNSYLNGDKIATANYLDQVPIIAQEVTAQAAAAKDSAVIESRRAFEATIVFIVVGSLLFILGLFLAWRLVKRRYVTALLESKPRVVNN